MVVVDSSDIGLEKPLETGGGPASSFLKGGGEMGALMRAHDWSASPLGEPEAWPQSLRTAVSLMINSKHPMFIAWGPELAFLYNDGYIPIFGAKHPHTLGLPFKQVWAEIWDDISPLIERALAGEATWSENLHLLMERNGYPEDTWYTFSYSPVRDESGGVAGMFCACTETTGQVLAERRLTEERERQRRLFKQAPGFITILSGPELRFEFVNEAYDRLFGPRDFVGKTVREMFPDLEGQPFFDLLDNAYATGERFVAHAIPIRLQATPDAEPADHFLDFIYEPVRDEAGAVTGLFIEGYDVTEAHVAQGALRESEERFARALEAGDLGAWELDLATHRAWRSLQHDRIFGYDSPLPEWTYESFIDHVLPEDRDVVDRKFQEALTSGRWDFEARIRRVDGALRWLWAQGKVELDEGGRPLRMKGMVRDISERKEAEAALGDSGERLRLVLDSAPGAFYSVDREGNTTLVSRGFIEMMGFGSDDEAVGRKLHDLIHHTHPDGSHYPVEECPIYRCASVGEAAHVAEELFFRRDGAAVPVEYWVSPIMRGGEHVGAICTILDLTQRKAAEMALRESEKRYRMLFESIDSGFCIIEMIFGEDGRATDYRFVEANPAFERQSGLIDAVGRRMSELTPDLEEHWFERYGRVALTGESMRVEGEVAPLGRWLDINAFRVGPPEQRRVAVLFTDISARRKAETGLRELNETLEAQVAARSAERDRLWNLSQDMLARADYSGMMSAVSPAWTQVLGWSEEELLTRGYATFMHPDDMPPTLEAIERMAETRQPARFENRIANRDGGWKHIEWTVAPEPDGMNFIAVGRDLSLAKAREAELAAAQEALRQSQKLEAMGQLTGGVAHDFNNLLSPIVGSLDMLQRKGVGDAREQRLIGGALQSAERAKTLVQRLLAFARRQPLQPVPVDVGQLVDGMADLVASTSGPQIKVKVDVAGDLPSALADPNQLEMAILNLSVNARDAMPDGGTLSISGVREEVEAGHRSKLSPGAYVRLSVADTGCGMDEATLARAIEPFFSTKGIGRGTGLGLSMVHGLALQLGGALTVSSKPGLGTSAELWLPVSGDAGGATERPSSDAQDGTGTGTALLVDDEELVRMSTADMLADLGYEVVEAASAEEALTLFREGRRIDLLITDHLMPGMTGADLARTVRETRPELPILIVSGYAEADGVPSDFPRLTKPFRQADLSASVAELTDAAP